MTVSKEVINVLNKLVKLQYKYERDSLEAAGKVVKAEKDLVKIYKSIIEKEMSEVEDREN